MLSYVFLKGSIKIGNKTTIKLRNNKIDQSHIKCYLHINSKGNFYNCYFGQQIIIQLQKQKINFQNPFHTLTMSVLAARRKTLYELNAKVPDYKRKSTLFEVELLKKTNYFQQKQQPSRRRFQSTNVYGNEKQNSPYSHPIVKFLNNNQSISDEQLRKFSSFLYKGVKYSVNLKQPSNGYIEKRKLSILDVSLPGEQFDLTKKLLVLDLDQTLIHSVGNVQQADVTLKLGKNVLKFNIRPYCYRFLQEMEKHYNVVVYTASTESYAHPIVEYLNKPKKTIKAVFSRNHCLQTHNGFHIKDLRIIKEFDLKKIIIIDNLVHSFAFQLDNGIPILEFIANKKDRELYYLCQKLVDLSKTEDVRKQIKKTYNITQVLEHQETDFIWNGESRY